MEIEVYGKVGRGHKAAITRKVRATGNDGHWNGNTFIYEGAYWGIAVEIINSFGYETDEDETTE